MPNGLLSLALGVAMQVGSPGPSEMPNYPAPANAYGRYGFEGSQEQRYPFDTQQQWVHGYFQELPAYGGHPVFRPYNYKHVLSQSQTAAGWGERPGMPYSQQFWHKYHDQATMIKTSQNMPVRNMQQSSPAPSANAPLQSYAGWSVAPATTIPVSQPGASAYPSPYQTQTPNYSSLFDQPRGPIQPPSEGVSPTAYRSSNGRGY